MPIVKRLVKESFNPFIQNRTQEISSRGPLSVCQQNAIQMVCLWRADGGPTLCAGWEPLVLTEESIDSLRCY